VFQTSLNQWFKHQQQQIAQDEEITD
jgi:hypothetical protein